MEAGTTLSEYYSVFALSCNEVAVTPDTPSFGGAYKFSNYSDGEGQFLFELDGLVVRVAFLDTEAFSGLPIYFSLLDLPIYIVKRDFVTEEE